MNEQADNLVCLTSGALIQVQILHDVLRSAGIESRIVGDDLTAGLGTALPDSIELWIHTADAAKAEAAMAGSSGHQQGEPEAYPIPLTGIGGSM